MIFKPELARKVVDGSKTMTRRQIRPNGFRYRTGKEYAVQPGRGKFHVCHIRPYLVVTQMLGGISYDHAVREGFEDRNAFIAYWKRINGDWSPTENVTVIGWSNAEVRDCCAELEA